MVRIKKMGVDTGGNRGVTVTHRFADIIQLSTQGIGDRRKCVAKSMQSDLWQVIIFDKLGKQFGDIVWSILSSISHHHNQIILRFNTCQFPELLLPFLSLFKHSMTLSGIYSSRTEEKDLVVFSIL